jgi:uncharacterized membrane protein YkoI
MEKKKTLLNAMAALAAIVGATTVPALATDAATLRASDLSPAEILRAVESAGYTHVRDMEFDDGRWELDATSPAGMDVELEVDATNGQILHEESD